MTRLRLLLLSTLIAAWPAHAQTFNGYECTEDCSGHEAGYEWAQDNDIDDESDCSTASNSFNEGCQSFVDEQDVEQSEDEAEEE